MRFRSHQCWFPRDAEKPLEYEDASAHSEKWGRAIIADGVSSAIFSRTWARLLTRTAVRNPPALSTNEDIADWLRPLQQSWQQEISQAKISVPLWAVTPKINSIGGQATLLVVEIEPVCGEDGSPTDAYHLRARGIGDSVLYLVRAGEKILSFPITESAAFEQPPWVASSIARDIQYATHVQRLDTECRIGDLLVLCTDAIGKWSMREYEAGGQVDWMRYWGNDESWQADVVRLRAKGPTEPGSRLVVDDCTLLLLEIVAETIDANEPDTQPDRSDEEFVLLGSRPAEPVDVATSRSSGNDASAVAASKATEAAGPTPHPETSTNVHPNVENAPLTELADRRGDEVLPSTPEDDEPHFVSRDNHGPSGAESRADSADMSARPEGPVTAEGEPDAGRNEPDSPPLPRRKRSGFFSRMFGFRGAIRNTGKGEEKASVSDAERTDGD